MMFDIVKGVPVIKPESLTIPELRKIWDADTSKEKEIANKKLTYIYHLIDPRSDYSKVGEDLRKEIVDKDHLKGFKIDKDMEKAIQKAELFQLTVPLRFLKGVSAQLIKMAKYMEDADPDDENIVKLSMVIGKGADLISSHQQLEEKVAQQLKMGSKIKRDIKPNMFDDEHEATA